jgi:uncharacterized membrane protein
MKDLFHTGAGGALSLERLVFFSDAVFAIAITLLVIEIEIPKFPVTATHAEEWGKLAEMWPQFFAFFLSFMVIGRFWIGHHQLFERVQGFSAKLLWPNLMLLLAIAFMPFSTALLGSNIGFFVPSLIYNLSLLVTSILALFLHWRIEQLGLTPRDDDPIERGGPQATVFAALVTVGLTFVIPHFSQLAMMTIPLWRRLFRRQA